MKSVVFAVVCFAIMALCSAAPANSSTNSTKSITIPVPSLVCFPFSIANDSAGLSDCAQYNAGANFRGKQNVTINSTFTCLSYVEAISAGNISVSNGSALYWRCLKSYNFTFEDPEAHLPALSSEDAASEYSGGAEDYDGLVTPSLSDYEDTPSSLSDSDYSTPYSDSTPYSTPSSPSSPSSSDDSAAGTTRSACQSNPGACSSLISNYISSSGASSMAIIGNIGRKLLREAS